MLVLFAVFSVRGRFRRTLQMDGESVTRDARVKRLIRKFEGETKLVTVIGDGTVKIIHQKLRDYPGKARSRVNGDCGHQYSSSHVITRRLMVGVYHSRIPGVRRPRQYFLTSPGKSRQIVGFRQPPLSFRPPIVEGCDAHHSHVPVEHPSSANGPLPGVLENS